MELLKQKDVHINAARAQRKLMNNVIAFAVQSWSNVDEDSE